MSVLCVCIHTECRCTSIVRWKCYFYKCNKQMSIICTNQWYINKQTKHTKINKQVYMCMYIHIAVVHLQCFGEKKCNAKMSIIYTNEWYINKQTKDPSPPKKKKKKKERFRQSMVRSSTQGQFRRPHLQTGRPVTVTSGWNTVSRDRRRSNWLFASHSTSCLKLIGNKWSWMA